MSDQTEREAATSNDRSTGGLTGALTRAATWSTVPSRAVWSLLRRESGIDWQAHGLLDGVDGDAREQREALLEHLARGGVPLAELRQAVEQGRLALLPVERALAGEDRYTCRELAERVGMDVDDLRGDLLNLGFSVPPSEEEAFDEHDLAAACAIAAFRDAGLDGAGLRGVGRVLGQCLRAAASASRELIAENGLQPGDGEHDLGVRYAQLAEALAPELQTLVASALRVHLREGVRQDVVSEAQRQTGRLPETVSMSVAFADLAHFTTLTRSSTPSRVAAIADRFAELVTATAQPPVYVVKLLGDGALIAAPDASALVATLLGLGDGLAADPLDMPDLHGGVASGDVVARRGDLYGNPVNLAARLCQLAEPGCLLADEQTRRAAPDLAWGAAHDVEVQGFDRPVSVFALDTEGTTKGSP
jgi:adenylate cyclase